MINSLKTIIALILTGLTITSCQNKTVLEEYIEFENLTWNRFDILKFETEIEDVESYYDIFFSFRHLPDYPYEKLDINFTIFPPSGGYRSSEHTFWIKKGGAWESECLGDYCDYLVPIREKYKFSEAGTLKFEIENKMTKYDLPGVMEVGLIVKKSKRKSNI